MNSSFDAISQIPIVSIDVLPPNARYWLIDMISFQSTLGTGFFSEFGSVISNTFGTEAKTLNAKIEKSIGKCKDAMRALAHQKGANAVIGADFDFSTNTRDATTVAAQGTAVFIENIEEIFRGIKFNALNIFHGETDLSNSSYQLFLTKRYSILKNDTLNKFLIGDEVYEDILLALSAADNRYQAAIIEIEESRALQEAKTNIAAENKSVTDEQSRLMAELGITFDGEKFLFETYRYEKLDDAINYAKKQRK